MTLLSGWCIDEKQALEKDQKKRATRLHNECRFPRCSCPNHGTKKPAKKLNPDDYL